ncbi:EAL domain-containing protein, partial [Bittarella massiliensis (ex Durand et al. 2017)]
AAGSGMEHFSLVYQPFVRFEEGGGLQQSARSGMEHFSLVYQPFVRFEEGGGLQLVGAEALLRWSCEPIGPVSPVEFIPLLESSGLIAQLGRWVLEEAVTTCKR